MFWLFPPWKTCLRGHVVCPHRRQSSMNASCSRGAGVCSKARQSQYCQSRPGAKPQSQHVFQEYRPLLCWAQSLSAAHLLLLPVRNELEWRVKEVTEWREKHCSGTYLANFSWLHQQPHGHSPSSAVPPPKRKSMLETINISPLKWAYSQKHWWAQPGPDRSEIEASGTLFMKLLTEAMLASPSSAAEAVAKVAASSPTTRMMSNPKPQQSMTNSDHVSLYCDLYF